jgi:CheY-like chemotaxis protein
LVRFLLELAGVQSPDNTPPKRAGKPVILIVEDEVAVQNLVRFTLEQEGYVVLTANNGEEALSLSERYPDKIDLVLTDVTMGEMSGLELSERISSARPGIRIIVMSGDSLAEDSDATVSILQKPFTLTELKKLVRELVPNSVSSTKSDSETPNRKPFHRTAR